MRAVKRQKSLIRRKPRENSADAEMKLWLALRARRLGGFKFIRQGRIGRYAVDFVCREKYLAVEIEGGQHVESKKDRGRDLMLASKGYRVLRFWRSDVLQNIDGVLQALYAELCAR